MGIKYLACLGVFRAEKEKECSKNDGDATTILQSLISYHYVMHGEGGRT